MKRSVGSNRFAFALSKNAQWFAFFFVRVTGPKFIFCNQLYCKEVRREQSLFLNYCFTKTSHSLCCAFARLSFCYFGYASLKPTQNSPLLPSRKKIINLFARQSETSQIFCLFFGFNVKSSPSGLLENSRIFYAICAYFISKSHKFANC